MNDKTMMASTLDELRTKRAGQALTTPVDDSIETLQGVPAAADKIADKLAVDLDKVREGDIERMGTEWRDSEITRVTTAAGAAVTDLVDSTALALRTIATWRLKQTEGTGDANERLLAELQEQRAWTRQRAQLESGASVTTLIEQARQADDYRALTALRAEFTAWAATQDRPVGDPVTVTNSIVDALLEVAPKAERAVLSLDRKVTAASESAEHALRGVKARVESYGAYQEDPRALNRAVRLMDVRRVNGMA